jgi:nicotinamide-nucleotide amidase
MIAEILSTGDEVRSGALVDSNAAHIAAELEAAGLYVARHGCVGDDVAAIAGILGEIGTRAEVACVTGGLGPTQDDLTAAAAARAAGVELAFDGAALAEIEGFFRSRGRTMPAANRKQALLPRGAERLPNPLGTAPGFALPIGRCRCFFMPGVPAEMRRMLRAEVLPRIARLQGQEQTARSVTVISTFGLAEALVDERLAGFDERFATVKLGLRAHFPEIQVRLYGQGPSEQSLRNDLAAAAQWVQQQLGAVVFSTRGWSMEAEVGEALAARRLTLAVAESCTGGLIGHRLTEVAGSSRYFRLAVVAYANEAKERVLGVPAEVLQRCGAVHEETAMAMAQGVRRLAGADYSLATSGIAGPEGGTPEKPVGTLCVGLAGPEGVEGRRLRFSFGNRGLHKQVFAMAALELLRRRLLRVPEPFEDRR